MPSPAHSLHSLDVSLLNDAIKGDRQCCYCGDRLRTQEMGQSEADADLNSLMNLFGPLIGSSGPEPALGCAFRNHLPGPQLVKGCVEPGHRGVNLREPARSGGRDHLDARFRGGRAEPGVICDENSQIRPHRDGTG